MGILVRDPTQARALPLEGQFRTAMRDLAGGVGIITVGAGEDRTGLAATSVASLSVDPPSLIVCVNRSSSSWSMLRRYGSFGVNLLQSDQAAIAERFSGRGGLKGAARYAGAAWTSLVTGAPILEEALAAFDCEVEDMIERHSHDIVIGRVMAVRLAEEADPLLYWRGAYLGLGGR
jgi:flavin reductase (DIM6/NTAB) family NADH-FMN oxidoreductase RutF